MTATFEFGVSLPKFAKHNDHVYIFVDNLQLEPDFGTGTGTGRHPLGPGSDRWDLSSPVGT